MKNNVIILLLALFLVSCQSNPSKDYILLTGTISGTDDKDFRLSSKEGTVPIKLAEDGSFSSDTITAGTGHYYFGTGGIDAAELYLFNGGAYNLTAVSQKFQTTAKLTGPNSDTSNYLLSKEENMEQLRGDFEEFNSLKESDFIAKQKEVYENSVSYLDSFSGISKEFAEKERDDLYYYHLLILTRYERLHAEFTKQPNFKVSADFLKEFEGVDYANEELYKRRGSYKSMVSTYYEIKADSAATVAEAAGNERYLATLKVFGAIHNNHIKNDLLMSVAPYEIGYTDNMDAYYNGYMALSTSVENDSMMTKKYEGLKKLSTGATSPIFENYINHAGGTTSLSDFKGKYLYIDIWATWCGPCIAEVPFLREVEKQYHGKNIAFASISIDNEKQHGDWRKMVTDDEFGGIQLLADKDFDSDFMLGYEVNSIPRFVLIDPDGNIVSSNAPRPSDPSLVDLLKELSI